MNGFAIPRCGPAPRIATTHLSGDRGWLFSKHQVAFGTVFLFRSGLPNLNIRGQYGFSSVLPNHHVEAVSELFKVQGLLDNSPHLNASDNDSSQWQGRIIPTGFCVGCVGRKLRLVMHHNVIAGVKMLTTWFDLDIH